MAGEANCPKCGRDLALTCFACDAAESKEIDAADHARDVRIRKDVDAEMRAALGPCWDHLWGPPLEQLGHIIDLDRRRAERVESALRKIAEGKTAADNAHPLGEYASMAMRFVSIAQDSLRSTSASTPVKP